MPNYQPRKRAVRAVRVEDELWDAALSNAQERGETLAEHVIRPALEAYNKRCQRERERAATSAAKDREGV
jgi:hypothetical protein